MHKVDDERLKKYKKSLESAWGYNDYNDWPIKVNSIMHLYLKEFAKEMIEDINAIKLNDINIDELLMLFGNPARIYRLIDPVIFGMKRLNLPVNEQREMVITLLDYVKRMKVGSEFNEDGYNLILPEEKVTELLKSNNVIVTDQKISELIQRFCGMMWSYTESVFFRAHEVTKEVHGRYALEKEHQLVIREYFNLRPMELWDADTPFIKHEKIQVYTIYNKNLELDIDSYNHLFLKDGNYKDDMVGCFILADGNPIEISELSFLMEEIIKTIAYIHNWADSAHWRDKANKYADIYWYRKSPFRKILGKPTSVPGVVRESIEKGEPDPRRINNLTEKEIRRLIQTMI